MESCFSSWIRFLENDYFIFCVDSVLVSKRKQAQWSRLMRMMMTMDGCWRKEWNGMHAMECCCGHTFSYHDTTSDYYYRLIYFINARTYFDWTEVQPPPLFVTCAYWRLNMPFIKKYLLLHHTTHFWFLVVHMTTTRRHSSCSSCAEQVEPFNTNQHCFMRMSQPPTNNNYSTTPWYTWFLFNKPEDADGAADHQYRCLIVANSSW